MGGLKGDGHAGVWLTIWFGSTACLKQWCLLFRCGVFPADGEDNARVKDLSLAKQRFDSSATPTSRLILLHEAVLLTAQQICDTRKNTKEAAAATVFLMNATPVRELH